MYTQVHYSFDYKYAVDVAYHESPLCHALWITAGLVQLGHKDRKCSHPLRAWQQETANATHEVRGNGRHWIARTVADLPRRAPPWKTAT